MERGFNGQVAAFQDIANQIIAEVLAPDAVAVSSGYSGGGRSGEVSEPTPRSFPGEDGGTVYQLYTQLDETEGGGAAM